MMWLWLKSKFTPKPRRSANLRENCQVITRNWYPLHHPSHYVHDCEDAAIHSVELLMRNNAFSRELSRPFRGIKGDVELVVGFVRQPVSDVV